MGKKEEVKAKDATTRNGGAKGAKNSGRASKSANDG